MTKAQVIAEHYEKRANGRFNLVQYRDTPADLAKLLTRHPYTWPGSYPLFGLTDDGGVLCRDCCRVEFRRIAESIPKDGFYLKSLHVNWENTSLYCDHCSDFIESAYGNDETEHNP